LPNESRRARLQCRVGESALESTEVRARERERGRDAQEGVAERHLADVLHVGVVDKVAVDEEEDGEVDLFAGEEALLLEAEALDLGKVRRDLRGRERRQSK